MEVSFFSITNFSVDRLFGSAGYFSELQSLQMKNEDGALAWLAE